jgi:2-oxoisovalerate dehydrogenase E1 component beta subunit
MVHESIEAVRLAAEEDGIECDLVDLRTLWPVDVECLIGSVVKTGRVVIVHEAPKTCGFGAELMALVNERAFVHLQAPPVRVTGWDTPFPYTLEMDYLPLVPRIRKAIRETARF